MKKSMVLLFTIGLSILVLLSACERDNPAADVNLNTNPSTIPTDPNVNTNPNANQNSNGQNSQQGEFTDPDATAYGMVFGIDGTKITINASNIMVFFDPGETLIQPDGSRVQEVKEDTFIRLTDDTEIEVRTTRGGQIINTRAGTADDLSLQNFVLAEGVWEGDELIATRIVLLKF